MLTQTFYHTINSSKLLERLLPIVIFSESTAQNHTVLIMSNGSEMYDEQRLVEFAKDGHQDSFGKLYEHNFNKLVLFLARRTGNSELAKDIAQDAFIAAWQNIGKFRGESSLYTWLVTIALKKLYRLKNSVQGRAEHVSEQDVEEEEFNQMLPDPSDVYDKQVEISMLLSSLPLLEATVIELFSEGWSHDEIADALGLSSGYISNLVSSARKKLQ
jgi:RNA polymerase sigma-70 factor (ECF subfamily)